MDFLSLFLKVHETGHISLEGKLQIALQIFYSWTLTTRSSFDAATRMWLWRNYKGEKELRISSYKDYYVHYEQGSGRTWSKKKIVSKNWLTRAFSFICPGWTGKRRWATCSALPIAQQGQNPFEDSWTYWTASSRKLWKAIHAATNGITAIPDGSSGSIWSSLSLFQQVFISEHLPSTKSLIHYSMKNRSARLQDLAKEALMIGFTNHFQGGTMLGMNTLSGTTLITSRKSHTKPSQPMRSPFLPEALLDCLDAFVASAFPKKVLLLWRNAVDWGIDNFTKSLGQYQLKRYWLTR